MSDDVWRSVLVLDLDGDDGIYMVSGLTANTDYTLRVAAVSIAGQSEDVVIQVSTADMTLSDTVWFTVAAATVAPVIIILALIGLYTCGRCV